ncbi:MAG: Gfo/Idh/MocA family oxidoreductase [Ruminococcaceae bacterium]|nr:Gfo/Idh/MocA family oxidoreductase [Oscillospiraceae bacterium]
MKQVKLAVIGLGQRGAGLLKDVVIANQKADVLSVCDIYEDRMENGKKIVREARGKEIVGTLDYNEAINVPGVEVVCIFSAWESHIPIALAAMEAGKDVAMEVGGAYTVDQCWELVNTAEKTGRQVMLLENCCYGRKELTILNMVRKGLFGEIVHCAGGYMHDLRDEVAEGKERRHYRLRNYLNRNCENYPTHELGPIARVLDINRGNRMLTLTSTASRAAGLHQYILDKKADDKELVNARFAQGDIVTTVIKCASGETITLQLDTTLPRPYCRGFTVRGTKGMYEEATDWVFIDGDNHFKKNWGNREEYEKEHLHPIWKQYLDDGVQGTHDGMDWLEFDRFFDCCLEGRPFEIDVYDAASWMVISALSEKSISLGSMPVEIPDFTKGKWIVRKNEELKPHN